MATTKKATLETIALDLRAFRKEFHHVVAEGLEPKVAKILEQTEELPTRSEFNILAQEVIRIKQHLGLDQ